MLPRPGQSPLGAVPQTGSEALAAASAMQERAGLLRRLSCEHLRHLARPFFAAGWLPRDVLHAIDHAPDGRQHRYTAEVRSPAGWARSRLAAWLGPDGAPLPSRSQQAAQAHRQALAGQAARRARDAAARAQAADYPAQAARAREMLARALGRNLGQPIRPTAPAVTALTCGAVGSGARSRRKRTTSATARTRAGPGAARPHSTRRCTSCATRSSAASTGSSATGPSPPAMTSWPSATRPPSASPRSTNGSYPLMKHALELADN